ncbi:zinc finger protein 62-like [Maniola jurtina]|uniref:zinc finger protein 62-like n=1 Tax=Maniola jurtina TaxID=191418 RepID=UPI001E686C4D|nr:zinc finger protein 62-like [Maniola jurtina]
MKVNKIRVNMEEYYSGIHNMPLPVFSKHLKRKTKCRACMQEGDILITNITKPNEMTEALNIFGNIETDDDLENPTYLCYICYKFLKSAILFRKVAQRTNETLRQPLVKQSPDHLNDYEDNLGTFEDDQSDQIYSTKDFKCKKQPNFECKQEPIVKGNKVECPICKKLLGKSYYYNIHLQLHNPNLPDQYVCDICGKSFKLKKVYSGHMERHETRYIFKCDLCPYAGRYKERLSMHMRVHTGELKYLCTQCPARYVTRGRLNDHVKLKHTKPQYKCTYCVKAYHSSLYLQRHIDAAHLGIKSHECNLCSKTFSYRKKLLEHLKIIHKTSLRPNVRRLDRKSVKQQ